MAGLAGFPPDPKLDDLRGLNASGVFDRWRCNRMMFIAIGDDLHKVDQQW